MEITREYGGSTANFINAYEAGNVYVKNVAYSRSIILTPTEILADWQPDSVDNLQIDHFERVIEFNPEIVVLGTGSRHVFLDRSFMLHLLQHGAGLETMDTPAACRTYNILLAEGRRVVAALLIPG